MRISPNEGGWTFSPGAPYRLQSKREIMVTTSTLGREADEQTRAIEEALKPAMRTRTA